MIYAKLPEATCALLRGAVGGFVPWWDDFRTMEVVLFDGTRVPVNDAMDYVDTWRRSGLWALRGYQDERTDG